MLCHGPSRNKNAPNGQPWIGPNRPTTLPAMAASGLARVRQDIAKRKTGLRLGLQASSRTSFTLPVSTLARANGTPYAPRLNLGASGLHDAHEHDEPLEGKGRLDYSSVPAWATRTSAASPLGASLRSRFNCKPLFPSSNRSPSCCAHLNANLQPFLLAK